MRFKQTDSAVLTLCSFVLAAFGAMICLAACDSTKSTVEAPRAGAPAAAQPATSHNGIFEVSDANFDAEVLKAKTPVLVDFWAPWCGPCRLLGPTIEELARDYAGKVKVCKVNVDQSPIVSEKYAISNIPLVALFSNGKVVKTILGLNPKQAYTQAVSGQLSGG